MPVLVPDGPAARHLSARTAPWQRTAAAAGWALGSAAGAAAGWAVAVVLARQAFGALPLAADVRGPLELVAAVAAGTGGATGLVVGVVAGLVLGRPRRLGAALAVGLIGAAAGALGGALCPVVIRAGWGLRPEAACAVAWAFAGLVAGPAGYAWSRWTRPADRLDTDWVAGADDRAAAGRAGAAARLLPVWVVAGACLVAVVVTPPSPAGWAVLAAGLLGLAVGWALTGQEQRIRELARRLAELDDPADRRLAP